MKKSLSKQMLYSGVFTLLLFASFSYGMFSVINQNMPFRIIRYLNEQKNKIFSESGSIKQESKQGAWHIARSDLPNQGLTDEQRESLAKVTALPYLKGYYSAPDKKNVTVYNKEAAYHGLNLVVSGHGTEAILMDMEGKVLHSWQKDFEDVWPSRSEPNLNELYKTFWRRAHLFDNGDLLVIFKDYGLVKLDKNSDLLWAYEGRCHHDLFVFEDENIYVLSRQRRKNPRLQLESWGAKNPYWEDLIVILNSEGIEQKRINVVDCFLNSEYAPMLEHIKVRGNILHANSIEMLDGKLVDKLPMFKKSHILISLREIHTIAVIDLEQEKVMWALTGMWKYQHAPSLLKNGNVLLFDNRGNNGKSKIVEINPLDQKIVWTYKGTAAHEFFSMTAGTTERLSNGNTMITETNNGRAFEVTPAGEIVWEFFNPYRTGENNKLIAALCDVIRYDQNQFDWLSLDAKSE